MIRDRTRQIRKVAEDLNDIIKQLDLADLSRTLHLTTAEYRFFLTAHETLSRIGHRLGHSLNTFKSVEIPQNTLSNHSGKKLEIKNRKFGKSSNVDSKQHIPK